MNEQSGRGSMAAMAITRIVSLQADRAPLSLIQLPIPTPGPGEVLIKVSACGVCHTELDEIEGRTPPSSLPMVPGHEVVGYVEDVGSDVQSLVHGERVSVGWIHSSTGSCDENLDAHFRATGRDVHGGYAQYMTVPERYAYRVPERFSDEGAAPLLCAGAVGYRALKLTGLSNGQRLGLTGFGGSAHLVLQLTRYLYPDSEIHVFARDVESRRFAISLGADSASHTLEPSPNLLDAIIDTTPAWTPVLSALENLRPGGRLVINAIRKESGDREVLLDLDYARHLWLEKEVKTVANITHHDIAEFLPLAASIPIEPEVQVYPFESANEALCDLKFSNVRGAKVLRLAPP